MRERSETRRVYFTAKTPRRKEIAKRMQKAFGSQVNRMVRITLLLLYRKRRQDAKSDQFMRIEYIKYEKDYPKPRRKP